MTRKKFFKANLTVSIFLFLLIIGLFPPAYVFAQTTAKNSSLDLELIIKQLQEQIKSLQEQVMKLKSELGVTLPQKQTPSIPVPQISSAPAIETESEETENVVAEEEVEEEIEIEIEIEIPKITKTLFLGSRGEEVTNLQKYLAQDKKIYPEGLITGYFGPFTKSAVKKFQKKHGISSVGIVGSKTIAKLNELIEEDAGGSEIKPPGLFRAPGLQQKIVQTPLAAATTRPPEIPAISSVQKITITPTTTPPISSTTVATTTITTVAITIPSGTIPATPAIPAVPVSSGSVQTTPAVPATSATPAQPASQTATTTPAVDTAAPTIPTNITVTAISSTQINLFWTASTDNVGVAGYRVYRGGAQIAVVTAGAAYSDTGLSPATTYSYTVAAYDAAGNISSQSISVSATTQAVLTHSCGTSISVPQDTSSIQAALDAVCSGDTIYVNSGVYTENLTVRKANVTLKGASGTTPDSVIIDGGGLNTVINVKQISSFTIEGITLQNAKQDGSWPAGAGLSINPIWSGTFSAKNLVVKNNSYGVFVVNLTSGTVTLDHNVIANNIINGIQGDHFGSAQLIITNNTIAYNGRNGYGDWAGGGSRIFKNNIIVKNGWYGAYFNQNSGRTISYNDAWDNTKGNYYYGDSYSNPFPFTPSPGTGELSLDPKFVSSSDYHLQSVSPVINAGDPSSANDSDGSRNDMGAYYFSGTIADISAPTAPTNFTATSASSSQTSLSWTASTDNVGVAGYRVYRGGAQIAVVTAGAAYSDTGLSPATTYSYTVAAYDAAGNVSGQSSSVSVTTAAAIPQVQGLTAAVSGASVNLSWQDVTGMYSLAGAPSNMFGVFNIYRGSNADFTPSPIPSNPTNLIAQGSVLSYTDSNRPAGTYYYKIALQDKNGVVGPASQAVSAVVSAALPNEVGPLFATVNDNTVLLSWASAMNATFYKLDRQLRGSDIWSPVSANITALNYSDSPGLGSFSYRLFSCNAAGCYVGYTAYAVGVCSAPYHVASPDGRCVWSCGTGTQPDDSNSSTGQCVCQSGYTESGTDQFGRRVCTQNTATTTGSVNFNQYYNMAGILDSLKSTLNQFLKILK